MLDAEQIAAKVTNDMKKHHGFTLVELSVVLVIIGLLIGGVIQAQSMIQEAQNTSTIAQVEAYNGAVAQFRSVYAGYPGDIDGEARLPNCNSACKPEENDDTINDGFVGNTWGTWIWKFREPGFDGDGNENILFWLHLYKAGLITDVNDQILSNTGMTFKFGVTHPAAAVGGGFIVKHPAGREQQIDAPGNVRGIQGLVIGLAKYPYPTSGSTGGLDQKRAGDNVLTPERAFLIDKKIDDGMPASGKVQGYGTRNSCFVQTSGGMMGRGSEPQSIMPHTGSPATTYEYDVNVSSKDCGLIFRIGN